MVRTCLQRCQRRGCAPQQLLPALVPCSPDVVAQATPRTAIQLGFGQASDHRDLAGSLSNHLSPAHIRRSLVHDSSSEFVLGAPSRAVIAGGVVEHALKLQNDPAPNSWVMKSHESKYHVDVAAHVEAPVEGHTTPRALRGLVKATRSLLVLQEEATADPERDEALERSQRRLAAVVDAEVIKVRHGIIPEHQLEAYQHANAKEQAYESEYQKADAALQEKLYSSHQASSPQAGRSSPDRSRATTPLRTNSSFHEQTSADAHDKVARLLAESREFSPRRSASPGRSVLLGSAWVGLLASSSPRSGSVSARSPVR